MDNPREHAHPSTKEYTKARPWRESPKLSSIPENKGGEVLIENRSRNPIIITIVSLMTNQSFLNEVQLTAHWGKSQPQLSGASIWGPFFKSLKHAKQDLSIIEFENQV